MNPAAAPLISLRLLIVEDTPSDAELMLIQLMDEGYAPDWRRVQTAEDFLAELAQGPELILCDWRLPRFSGLQAMSLLRERNLDIPLIIVSGSIGEEAALDALRAGAWDYVIKDRPARLGPAVRRALEEKRLRDQRRQAEEKNRLFARMFESTVEGIILTDANANILAVNPAFSAITGYSEEEAAGQNPRFLQSGRQDKAFYETLWVEVLATGQWRGEIWNRRKNGEIYPEWLTLSAIKDEAGVTTHYVGVFNDISHIKEAQQQIKFLAHHDPLTRLPNRTLFRDRLEHALQRARRDETPLAVLFIDMDRFKNVNDTLGHPVGDELLLAATQRIKHAIRALDTLARQGGDEFTLLIEDEGGVHNTAVVAQKLVDLFTQPLELNGHDLVVTVSIGISLYPSDAQDADTLLRFADRAMYEAKLQGRNTYRFYAPDLTAGAFERLVMENALRGAVARGELRLHYQPQVDLLTGRLAGMEALVRWQHPDNGLISPALFIPLAEETGLIGEIGTWVLSEACRQMIRWDAEGYVVPRIAVNLSAQQIQQAGLVDQVAATLKKAGLPGERLELEITESLIMQAPQAARRALEGLRQLGVTIAVDDFGTGYSSLAYLKQLPIDRLKVDQSFVRDIGRDSNDEAITRAVIVLARSLGLDTVAEGVELEIQAEFLRQEGCTFAQGYYYARPLPAEELQLTVSKATDSNRSPQEQSSAYP